jgi:hypothetical protein
MKVKNRPSEYVKRSSLPGRPSYIQKDGEKGARKPQTRDLMKVEVDARFYFTFRSSQSPKKI